MTGPEHYAMAERLLADIDCDGPRLWSDERDRATRGYGAETVAAVAQVHATLALAAATALGAWNETGMPQPDRKDWWRAASGDPAERRRIKEAEAAEAADFEEAHL